MARRKVEIEGETLWIRFPYDESLLPVVRGFSGRRFHRDQRAWSCPDSEVVDVVETLLEHRFQFDDKVCERYRKEGGAKLEEVDAKAAGPSKSLTVGELNQRVRQVLVHAFPDEVWLVGEVTGFDRNQHRKHVHFELAEKDGEGDDATIASTVSAVLFEGSRARIEEKLEAADHPFELQDGVEVRLLVRVDLYEPRGSYQVVVEDIDPVHTLGKLAQNRAKVLQELERRGLRNKNRDLPWPAVPLRVGMITSLGSDAYNDFVNELQRSGYAFQITAYDARMQGKSLEPQILAAIEWFSERKDHFDLVAVVRGGGARADLMWFDSLAVAVAIAECPLKVLSGIGHQRDVSVLDLIAHSEKTPTAAASEIVRLVGAFENGLRSSGRRLARLAGNEISRSQRDLRGHGSRLGALARGATRIEQEKWKQRRLALSRGARQMVRSQGQWLRRIGMRTQQTVRQGLAREQQGLRSQGERLETLGKTRLRFRILEFARIRKRLDVSRVRSSWERRSQRLIELQKRAELLHPRSILRRGFAWIRDDQGRGIKDASRLREGDLVHGRLAQGEFRARVLGTSAPELSQNDNQPATKPTKKKLSGRNDDA